MPSSKVWYIGQTYTILKEIKKETEKKKKKFPLELQKMRLPRHLIHFSTWKGRIGILDIDIQLNSLKTKWIQKLLNPTNALWKDLMLY